jgi:hypothetical protein
METSVSLQNAGIHTIGSYSDLRDPIPKPTLHLSRIHFNIISPAESTCPEGILFPSGLRIRCSMNFS